jgi:mRNA interferase MazF
MVKRGEIWLGDLNPTRGSEQAGTRPVLILQNNVISKHTTTVLAIPLTANLRRASLPSCVQISQAYWTTRLRGHRRRLLASRRRS